MTLNDVVKATIFIKNFDENFPLVNQVSKYALHRFMCSLLNSSLNLKLGMGRDDARASSHTNDRRRSSTTGWWHGYRD